MSSGVFAGRVGGCLDGWLAVDAVVWFCGMEASFFSCLDPHELEASDFVANISRDLSYLNIGPATLPSSRPVGDDQSKRISLSETTGYLFLRF